MPELSQGEQFLLDQIRRGDQDGWTQLIDRYQGRLVAFARARLSKAAGADADDLVQETFLQFLRGLAAFRAEASIETYLFTILRRRIIDSLRGRRVGICQINDPGDDDAPADATAGGLAAPDLTASAYARRDEQIERERSALADSLRTLIESAKEQADFEDVKLMESLFYAQLRNQQIAAILGLDEKRIALIKHRWLKELRKQVQRRLSAADAASLQGDTAADSLLTEIWEEHRLSCPKRSTVGGYVLGTLDAAWHDYVHFHVNKLGCRFCRANLADLQHQSEEHPRKLRQRIMESTVGFLGRSGLGLPSTGR